ncbi:hypothetical protein LTR04_006215 [Oleoguttula sp. CCFEE 6159]|nr:hypothetical protein LTR04_006215 [Oleoguttula sp. CCFEE 6159]
MSKVVRSVKNVTKGYSSVQVMVRNATSNDPWGPVGSDMNDIAKMTFNNSTDFYEIMDMLDKRLNDKGKNWRHVLKSLKVLDYCLHEGSELVVTWARKNIYIIKTLREFIYVDEDGRDVGQNVRVSAKELTSLILDEERLRAERANRSTWKSRVTGIEEFGPMEGRAGGSEPTRDRHRDRENRSRRNNDEEDLEYKLALEASKNEAEEDRKRRERNAGPQPDDDDLAKAIRLSKEEEELRKRELEEANASSLFDDTPAQAPQPTGYNQGYQQQGAVDWFGNPVEQQQQPQNTGFLNNAYSQPTGLQGQQPEFQNGYAAYGYQQPQQTGFDQSFQQMQPQATYGQPQQTSYNPWGQQSGQDGFGADQSQPLQQQNTVQAGSHNPWASSAQQQEPVRPQPTGSNNPFAQASAFNRAQPSHQQIPTLGTLAEQKTATQSSFGNQPSFNPVTSFSAPQPTAQQQAQQKPMDPRHAQLNALLSSGEGQDTFGNVGNLRIPAQHTAPGTFVNSAGANINRLHAAQTGNNPFLNSQFTGVPQTTGFAQQQMPAQTGPAGGFGRNPYSGGTNPFGVSGQRQGQGGQQSGSLIDL